MTIRKRRKTTDWPKRGLKKRGITILEKAEVKAEDIRLLALGIPAICKPCVQTVVFPLVTGAANVPDAGNHGTHEWMQFLSIGCLHGAQGRKKGLRYGSGANRATCP